MSITIMDSTVVKFMDYYDDVKDCRDIEEVKRRVCRDEGLTDYMKSTLITLIYYEMERRKLI